MVTASERVVFGGRIWLLGAAGEERREDGEHDLHMQ
jgi:hypothetical protein